MSTYVALLDGGRREETVRVSQLSPGVYRVEVGGKVHRVDAFRHDYGTISLLVDSQSYSVQLDQRGGEVQVHLRGGHYALEMLDERRLRMRRSSGKFTVEGRQILTSPMPGKVVRVLASLGAEVKEGEPLLVVEAMKMENELRSPRAGKVTGLFVVEGQAVEGGARLASIE